MCKSLKRLPAGIKPQVKFLRWVSYREALALHAYRQIQLLRLYLHLQLQYKRSKVLPAFSAPTNSREGSRTSITDRIAAPSACERCPRVLANNAGIELRSSAARTQVGSALSQRSFVVGSACIRAEDATIHIPNVGSNQKVGGAPAGVSIRM